MAATGKDLMASYVQQLLDLDESKRRATLQSLSKYGINDPAEAVAMDVAPEARSTADAVRLSATPRKVVPSSALSRSARPCSKLEPVRIELPPGLFAPSGRPGADSLRTRRRARTRPGLRPTSGWRRRPACGPI
mmetsp:Transcript_139954/g.435298  ORF Transcript_139954/g.435298 Transcript_139954/m.435298 type:complete len:134 (+) Transcript_139954:130-531(+)